MEIEEYVKNTRADVEKVMVERYPEIEKIEGKMLRSVLSVVISDCLGGDHKKAIDYGASVEFIHQGSLFHDDILDSHLERRGKPSSYITNGIKKALIIGDMHFTQANILASEKGSAEALEISSSMNNVLRGVMKELSTEKIMMSIIKGNVEDDIYFKIIDLKTASLFGCASKFGARAYTENESMLKDFYNYGIFLGEAYQVADDIVDLVKLADGEKEISVETVASLIPAILKYNKNFVKKIPFKIMTGKIGIDTIMEAFEEVDIIPAMKLDVKNLLSQADMICYNYKVHMTNECLLKEFSKYCVNRMLDEVGEKL